MAAKSVIRKGTKVLEGGGSSQFIGIEPDAAIVVAPLVGMDEMISIDLHSFWEINPAVHLVCLGDNCPCCTLGNESGFKAYLPVLTREGESKIFAFGIGVARQFSELEEEVGSLAGKLVKIRRAGSGLRTRYTVTGLGKSIDISTATPADIESQLGPFDLPAIIRKLEENGLAEAEQFEDLLPSKKEKPEPKAKKTAEPAPKGKKPVKPAPEETEKKADDWEDGEESEDWDA